MTILDSGTRRDTRAYPDRDVIAESMEDPTFFEIIHERHFSSIFRYVASRVGSQRAEDIASDVFLSAFDGRAKFRADYDSARPWLFGIATVHLASHLRQEARWLRSRSAAIQQPSLAIDGDWQDDVTQAIDAHHQARDAISALATMPEELRAAFLLHVVAECTYDEICAITDAPLGTVKSRISRARSRIAEVMEASDHGK